MRALLPQALELLLGSAVGHVQGKAELPDLAGIGSPPVFSLSPSCKLTDSLRQKGYAYVRYFAALPSYSKPRWLLPIGASCGMLAATQMYLPHTRTARILKSLVVRIIKTGWDGWLHSRVLIASRDPLPLEDLVRDITGEQRPIFALSLGRQPAVRKLTVQVMRPSGEVLGYMKLPLTDAAIDRVRNEAAVLERLWKFPTLRPHIPRLLYAGNWNNTHVLFQSPLKGEAGPISFDGLHERFLRALWNVRRVERPGQALIDKVATNWGKAAPILGGKWNDLGQEVLRRSTRDLQGKMLRYSVMHGDFAPWNTRLRLGELLLFDWESADWEAPSLWDVFHFRVQTTFSFKTNSGQYLPSNLARPETASFMLYLLNSVCQYLQEENYCAIGLRQKLLTSQLREENILPENPASAA
jgi:hypothetical protein